MPNTINKPIEHIIMNNHAFTEEQYALALDNIRYLFAWTLVRYGDFSHKKAKEEAMKQFPYQSENEDYRELVFHEEAWHWAMLFLYGENYWDNFPQYISFSDEYLTVENDILKNHLKFKDF